MSDYCETTGKYKFKTKGEAQRALRRMTKNNKGSCYQCPNCHDWHITHNDYRKSKAIRTVLNKRINQNLTDTMYETESK